MTQELWSRLIRALPSNLTVNQVSRLFRRSRALTRRRLVANSYRFKERIQREQPAWIQNVDWSQYNSDIAREFGKSRECVRQWRNFLGKSPVGTRGRRKNE